MSAFTGTIRPAPSFRLGSSSSGCASFCPQVFSTVLVRCKLLLEGEALTSSRSGGGGACGWLDGLPASCCLTSPLCSRLSPVNLFTLKEGLGSLAVIAH